MNSPVALITGSGRRRVGNVIARHLATKGYSIALHYHSSKESAIATIGELNNSGCECEAFQADLSAESGARQLVAETTEKFGRLDAVVCTASIWNSTPLITVAADDIEEMFRLNTMAGFFCAREAGTAMKNQQSGGSIILLGDVAIERPTLDYSAYLISKGALPTMTRVLAVELAQLHPKIRVNCIQPGSVMFPETSTEEERRSLQDSTLVRNADCPEAVAQACSFLIENEFVTGTVIPVDGGRSVFAPSDQIERSH